MRKSEMENLMAGQVVLDTRNNVELEIVGVGETKVILINGKEYSKSTLKRYFKLVEQEIPEVVEPLVEQQDNTVEQDTTVETDTATTNTATNNTGKTNTVQPTIQQNNLIQSLNNLVDLHGCYLEPKKEYIAVKKDGYKGTVCMIRNCRGGRGIHIDFKQKIWGAMDLDYTRMLNKNYYTGIYDKTRKLFRIGYVSDLDILDVIICTALQLAS